MDRLEQTNEYDIFKVNVSSGIEVILALYLSNILGYWAYDVWIGATILDPNSGFGKFWSLFIFFVFPVISWGFINLLKAWYKDKGIGLKIFILIFLISILCFTIYKKSNG